MSTASPVAKIMDALDTCTNCLPDLNLLVSPQLVQFCNEQVCIVDMALTSAAQRTPVVSLAWRSWPRRVRRVCSLACHHAAEPGCAADVHTLMVMTQLSSCVQAQSYGPTISGALFGAGEPCISYRQASMLCRQRLTHACWEHSGRLYAGWWFWADACTSAAKTIPFVQYLPGITVSNL